MYDMYVGGNLCKEKAGICTKYDKRVLSLDLTYLHTHTHTTRVHVHVHMYTLPPSTFPLPSNPIAGPNLGKVDIFLGKNFIILYQQQVN